eukprot:TRINITY_DN11368_c0_g1_i1.p1 TRINITY_DN11368_c0_g1~~TRINITY_DN11368_c0_g1_i1.p1  ORF type:complete len:135 (+),score=50.96 TRINITY_DN11368_c0_g1_i1:144-548(+)
MCIRDRSSNNVPIPANVSIGIVYDAANNSDPFADMHKPVENDGGLYSMSGLADSLPLDDGIFMGMAMSGPEDCLSKSINNYFAAAHNSFDDQRFMGITQPLAKSPDSMDRAMSPAQKIKLDLSLIHISEPTRPY